MKPLVAALAAAAVVAAGLGGALAILHVCDWYAQAHGWTGLDAHGGVLGVAAVIAWLAVYASALCVSLGIKP